MAEIHWRAQMAAEQAYLAERDRLIAQMNIPQAENVQPHS